MHPVDVIALITVIPLYLVLIGTFGYIFGFGFTYGKTKAENKINQERK